MKIKPGRWMIAGVLIAGMLAGFASALGSEPASTTAASAVRVATTQFAVGQAAPELSTTDLLTGKEVALADFRGKPLVLEFASITEPVFRLHAQAAEKLAGEFGDKAAFVIVYQREAHAADSDAALAVNEKEGFAFARPVSLDERVKLARQCAERLTLTKERIVIDAWNDTTSLRYGGLSNMTFLIDAEGRLAAGYPWMDARKLKGALDAVLAGKPVPAEFAGPTRSSTMPAADLAQAGGGGGPLAGLVSVLDRMNLTESQKAGILPPLTSYIAKLREFRETRQADADKPEAVKPEDLRNKIAAIRADGDALRAAFKDFLNAPDAKAATEALDRAFNGRAPRAK